MKKLLLILLAMIVACTMAFSLVGCKEEPAPEPEHTHEYGDWKSDDENHWKECSCEEVADKAAHVDEDVNGKCDVCDHDVEIPHTCDFSGDWHSDADGHWKECSCGEKAQESVHAGDANVDGKCDVCGFETNPAQTGGNSVPGGGNAGGSVETPDENI